MIVVVAGVCRRDGRILVAQRPVGKHLDGLWEFPGGKVEPDEDPRAALAREFDEELGVVVTRAEAWRFVWHAYPERTVLLLFYDVDLGGEPRAREGNPVRWVTPAELAELPVPAADRPIVDALCAPTVAAGPETL